MKTNSPAIFGVVPVNLNHATASGWIRLRPPADTTNLNPAGRPGWSGLSAKKMGEKLYRRTLYAMKKKRSDAGWKDSPLPRYVLGINTADPKLYNRLYMRFARTGQFATARGVITTDAVRSSHRHCDGQKFAISDSRVK